MGKYINEDKSDSRRKAKTTQMLTDKIGRDNNSIMGCDGKGRNFRRL